MLCADQLPACNGRNDVAWCCLHACFVESDTLLKHSELTKATSLVFSISMPVTPVHSEGRPHLSSSNSTVKDWYYTKHHLSAPLSWRAAIDVTANHFESATLVHKASFLSLNKTGCNISFDFRSQDNAWPLPVLVPRSMLPGYSAKRNVQRNTANCRSKIGASLSRIRSCSACSSFAFAMTPLIQLWEVLSSLYRWQCAWNHSLWAFRSFCCGDNSSSSLLSSSRCPQLRAPKTHRRNGPPKYKTFPSCLVTLGCSMWCLDLKSES